MITVIIAGGSGIRLWPLSSPEYPKQLLSLIDSASLIQNTYKRAKLLGDDVYIVTEKSHVNHIMAPLPDVLRGNIIIEPSRRGTASCIIATLSVSIVSIKTKMSLLSLCIQIITSGTLRNSAT